MRGLLHRVRRALPSCSRRHLSLRAHAWLLLSGRGSLRNGGDVEIVTAPVSERHSQGMDARLLLVPKSANGRLLPVRMRRQERRVDVERDRLRLAPASHTRARA
jgi:hypothetical protein